jgi:hypothetical protein
MTMGRARSEKRIHHSGLAKRTAHDLGGSKGNGITGEWCRMKIWITSQIKVGLRREWAPKA